MTRKTNPATKKATASLKAARKLAPMQSVFVQEYRRHRRDTAAAVAGIEVVEQFEGSGKDRVFVGYLKKYRIADKNSALEKLFRHHGLYERDNEQKTDPLTSLLHAIAGGNSSAFKPVADDPERAEQGED